MKTIDRSKQTESLAYGVSQTSIVRPKNRSHSPAFAGVANAVHFTVIALVMAFAVTPRMSEAAPGTFATTVVSYEPGAGAAARFLSPESALGQPSQVNPFGEPTDPFNPAYGTNQIVSIGGGGHLTLRFSTPIHNHPNNRFRADFTIFGNAGFIITNEFDLTTFDWIGTPATDGSLFGIGTGEVLVSVSRNGVDYFLLNPALAPRPDNFAPTDGSGDPGIPIEPGLNANDLAGATLDDMRVAYNGSAGGACFDLNWAVDANGRSVFLPEIRFVRIDVFGGRAEIDAVNAVDRVARGHQ